MVDNYKAFTLLWPLFGTYLCRLLAFSVPPQGLEPWTPTLRVSCLLRGQKLRFRP